MIEDATYIALSLLAAVAPSFLMWKVLSLLWNGVVRRKRDRLIRDLETEGAREAGWLYSDDEIQQLKDEIDKPKRCFAGLFDKITKKDIEDSFRDPPPPTWMKFEKEETCGKNLSADDIMRMRDRMEMIGEPLPCRTAGPAEEEGVKVGPFHHVTLTIDSRIPITIDQQRHGVRLNGVEDHMREVTHAVGQTIWTQKVTVMLDTVSFGRVVDYHAVHLDGEWWSVQEISVIPSQLGSIWNGLAKDLLDAEREAQASEDLLCNAYDIICGPDQSGEVLTREEWRKKFALWAEKGSGAARDRRDSAGYRNKHLCEAMSLLATAHLMLTPGCKSAYTYDEWFDRLWNLRSVVGTEGRGPSSYVHTTDTRNRGGLQDSELI